MSLCKIGTCKENPKSAKERQSKPSFLSWGGLTIRVTKNGPPMKILPEKDQMAIQECPHKV